jgi:histidinol dehydrogenase
VKTIVYGTKAHAAWKARLPRSAEPRRDVVRAVEAILRAVARDGDAALVRLTLRFDGVRLTPARLRVKPEEVRRLAARAPGELVAALRRMAARIEVFHRGQLAPGFRREAPDGSVLEEVVSPLGSAGLYVPGGAGAYPSSVLMNAIPAKVAGVSRIVVVTPPRALEANPAVAAAIVVAGVEEDVFRVGGAQAIAALAHGTKTIPAVDTIGGPGNAYVAAAKRLVRGRVAIDSEAGPSEVAILADDSADAGLVAADLLAQAEHGSGDEAVVLVTPSRRLAAEAARLVAEGLRTVANVARARRAVARRAAVVRVRDLDEGVAAVNELAPEHVEVIARGAARLARRIVGGAVFVGEWTPVAVGDYGVGPNHVLPTGGAARFASPLSVRDFQRRHSVVTMTRAGLAAVTEDVVRVAMAEGFRGHAQSVLARFEGE